MRRRSSSPSSFTVLSTRSPSTTPEGGVGPLRHLLQSWAETPGRGDFVANIFFYLPLGFFASLALAGSGRTLRRILLVTLAGGLLSTTMELAQYYIAGRVSAADDVYANLIGTVLGAIVGNFAGEDFLWLPFREIAANRVPCLLLGVWLGYRLYPYVPTIDLHKYWDALKPVVFHPRPNGYDLFRYTAIWLTIGSLIESSGGPRRGWLLFPLFIAAVLAARVLIIGKTLSAAEIGGAAIALAVWLLLAISVSARIRVGCHCPAVVGLHSSRAAGAVPVQRLRPGVRLDTISQLSVRLGRSQHNCPFSIRPFSTAP